MKKLVVCALCAAMVIPAMSVSVSADSKELVLYTWENMFPQEVLDGFEEETGIKVVYSNFDTDEHAGKTFHGKRWRLRRCCCR